MFSTVRIGHSVLDFSSPCVMTVLNMTPDSFYAGSRYDADSVLRAASEAVSQGASILDIGGCSTRPGSVPPDSEEEYSRVRSAFAVIRRAFPDFPLSLDTYRADVVRRIVGEFGPVLVNDISGCSDPGMPEVLCGFGLPYVLCHVNGGPDKMHDECSYGDMITEMLRFFSAGISRLNSSGIYDIIVDPNFGFSKDAGQCLELVGEFGRFASLGHPLLAGVSRKSFICCTAGCTPDTSLPATSAVHMALLERGASILRVHDTAAAVSAIRLYNAIK